MPSILPGFEYDIFISYRQKDNRSDQWVTNFVQALKEELDATFKDEISIYFDVNPHNGLLETHDVDDSLKEKIKCWIFIPIVSQTYCDPKSFAWQKEFLAFIDFARNDKYALNIKLPNGNVAKRVLPVRIHEIDSADKKLFEDAIGGVMRPVDFIFKSPGVNRPLRAAEDHPHDNQSKTFYRDQINKVANSIKDILSGIRSSVPSPSDRVTIRPEVDPIQSVGHSEKVQKPKITSSWKGLGKKRSRQILKVGIVIFILVLVVYSVIEIRSRLTAGKRLSEFEKVATEIQSLSSIERGLKGWDAYQLWKKIQNVRINQSMIDKMWVPISRPFTIRTEPEGAKVFIKPYSNPKEEWQLIGSTPIDNFRLPVGSIRIKIEKDGYETQEDVISDKDFYKFFTKDHVQFELLKPDMLPDGMVYCLGDSVNSYYHGSRNYPDFFIDQNEVTNQQYKQFVDAGGYREKRYWKHEFIFNGKTMDWKEAMRQFLDKTGRPGPSTWVAGSFPEGQENYPVTGVSWYEAEAYAEFSGKMLPTIYHFIELSMYWANAEIINLSNINSQSVLPVGTSDGVTRFGTHDLAGNVREWLFNTVEGSGNRLIPGGAWSDDPYVYGDDKDLSPFDRSGINGFRCMKYIDDRIDHKDLGTPISNFVFDISKRKPFSDSQFELALRQFDYDAQPVQSRIESTKKEKGWVMEKIKFLPPYDGDSMSVYLFLPLNASPPFQTVVYFPGGGAFQPVSSAKYLDGSRWDGVKTFEFLLKTGRAVLFPVYYSTMDRFKPEWLSKGPNGDRDIKLKYFKDLRRSIDYLSTREDIDMNKLGYLGYSQGGGEGGVALAIEKRLKAAVLVVCGISTRIEVLPEVDRVNFLPHVTQPVLMLNSLYDWNFPYDISQKPFFEFLGTPSEHKRLVLYEESGHQIPWNAAIKESLDWFDKYLGEVKLK